MMHADEMEPMPRTWVMNAAAYLAYRAEKYEEAEIAIALCRSLSNGQRIIHHKIGNLFFDRY